MNNEPNNPNANVDSSPGTIPPVLTPNPPASAGRNWLAILLSLFLTMFLLDAAISVVESTLMLFWKEQIFFSIMLLVSTLAVFLTVVVYVLMGLTPIVPKRWFLPLTLFVPVAFLAMLPFAIYHYEKLPWANWFCSLLQLILALAFLLIIRGADKFRWPLVPASALTGRCFSWGNLLGFAALNLLVLLPATILFLWFNATTAVNYFTDGFSTLHPGGFSVQARKYVRADGKTIELFPMSHVAEADFYRQISKTFPTNSIILMEGVTDEKNLLTNEISYKRMAKSMGLSEQHEQFTPTRGMMVRADIDVDQFSTNTLALLNLVFHYHNHGLQPEDISSLLQKPPGPEVFTGLENDLLNKRNQHLLGEIQKRLAESEYLVVPWGVAHMPGIAKEIQKSGFQLQTTHDYSSIRFFHPAAKP